MNSSISSSSKSGEGFKTDPKNTWYTMGLCTEICLKRKRKIANIQVEYAIFSET